MQLSEKGIYKLAFEERLGAHRAEALQGKGMKCSEDSKAERAQGV